MTWVTNALLAMFLCLATSVASHPAKVEEEKIGSAELFVSLVGDDIIVTITLSRPVTTLRLDQADVIRDDALRLKTPGLTFANDVISSQMPFTRATFRLIEDLSDRDAKYPPYYRIGQGRLIYSKAIYPDQTQWNIKLAPLSLPNQWVRWPQEQLPQGYLFIGPAAMIEDHAGARFVFDENVTEEGRAAVRDMVTKSVAFLAEIFGSSPPATPFIATSLISAERDSNVGDVTSSAMVALRFFGSARDPSARDALASTRALILHEGVHFWNAGVARFAPTAPQWLHEGGAEYIAALGSYRLGWNKREDLEQRIGDWFDRCATSLSYSNEPALDDLEFLNASLRYSCGPLLHTLIELYLAENNADRTITDVWRETVRQAAASDGEYDLTEFMAAVGDHALLRRPALEAILTTSGGERWELVREEMNRLGVQVERHSSPSLRAQSALMHMIKAQCTDLRPGQGYGFYAAEESYRLDTPEGCGVLSGSPVVKTLEGRLIVHLSTADYSHFQDLCARGHLINFGLTDETVIAVPCTRHLPDAATQPIVTSLPAIPAFSQSNALSK